MSEEITQITEVKMDVTPPQPKKEKGTVHYVLASIKEIISISFWVYVLAKLFIFDIDVFLIDKFLPNYAWLLNFKFFILIGTLATIWLITKNKHILSWSLYIFFYPAIIILWKLPFFIFKQKSWVFAFAVINTVISFFKSIKYNFIAVAFFLVSLAVIFATSNPKLLWPAILLVFIILSIIYIHRFIDSSLYLNLQVYFRYTSRFSLELGNLVQLLLRLRKV